MSSPLVGTLRPGVPLAGLALLLTACGSSPSPAPPVEDGTSSAGSTGGELATQTSPATCADCGERGWAAYQAEDYAAARPLFEQACDAGDAEACIGLGQIYGQGRGVPEDLPRSFSYFERGCTGGNGVACWVLGNEYRNGTHVGSDEARASTYYRAGCQAGHVQACREGGLILFEGQSANRDPVAAGPLFERSCTDEHPDGCVSLSVFLLNGPEAMQDAARSRTLLDEACQGQHVGACGVLGILLRDGLGGPADAARAATLFEAACTGGSHQSCQNFGAALWDGNGVAQDRARAPQYLRRACEAGERSACGFADRMEAQMAREAASGGAPAGDRPTPTPGPGGRRWTTTIGSSTIDDLTFLNVRATCGMLRVMAALGSLRAAARRCAGDDASPTVTTAIVDGSATEVSAAPRNRAGRCLERAVRSASFGGLTCDMSFSVRR
jgi:TPR repeat protein